MKALTIRQPWASLIMGGYKKYEFRSWKTKYRGELLIHAVKGINKNEVERLKDDISSDLPSSKILGYDRLFMRKKVSKIYARCCDNNRNMI